MNFNMLGLSAADGYGIFNSNGLGQYKYLATIVDFLDAAVVPFSVTLAIAAAVFSIVLGFMIMKAETADKASEMKRRLIGLIWTVIIVIAAVWLMGWLLSNFNGIMTTIRNMGSGL